MAVLPCWPHITKDLDVFVLWDASVHERFKHGGNMQVKDTLVAQAAATGRAEQRRRLRSGITEIVFACRSSCLPRTQSPTASHGRAGITE